jgi:tRNA(adenine34) deaminase
VLVKDNQIIARDGNRTLELNDPTAHAEILTIRAAGAILGSQRLTGCDLYVTLEPCPMCAAAISFARINRLYYGAVDAKSGGAESGIRFFSQPSCHHSPEIYGGIGAQESATLLKAFFGEKR